VVGLSGGLDSVTLLSVLAGLAGPMGFSLRALHVHHGISPNASQWARFCEDLCAGLGVPVQVEQARIGDTRALGLEGAARRARYAILAREDADFIVLAHHRDDQAETLLLQLLRGAGPLGMAGMPELRALPGSRAQVLRPLLAVARSEIEAWAREHGLAWIEDESNDDLELQRNFIRHRVLPLLEQRFPAARVTAARAAAHLAEAESLLSALAQIDLEALGGEREIELAGLRRLGSTRAKNALRYLCQSRAIPLPSAAQADELHRQLIEAQDDRTVLVEIGGWQFRRFRGRLNIERARPDVAPGFREDWAGENVLPLLALGGVLRFKPEEGRGVSVRKLNRAGVTVRLRRGGERFQPDARRPHRTLKNLLQEKGIPWWRRGRWPLVYCGEELVSVPGIGDDCAWQADRSEPGLIISWETLDQT